MTILIAFTINVKYHPQRKDVADLLYSISLFGMVLVSYSTVWYHVDKRIPQEWTPIYFMVTKALLLIATITRHFRDALLIDKGNKL